jgi:hypothetical protein
VGGEEDGEEFERREYSAIGLFFIYTRITKSGIEQFQLQGYISEPGF